MTEKKIDQILSETLRKQRNKKGDESITDDEVQVVVFKVATEEFGVNINEVIEITKLKEMTRVPNSEDYIDGVINLRGHIHVIVNLAKKIGVPPKIHDENTRIIMIEKDNSQVGMIVDEVDEVLRVKKDHIKNAPPLITSKINAKFITGVAIIKQRMIILLDLLKVIVEEKEIIDNYL